MKSREANDERIPNDFPSFSLGLQVQKAKRLHRLRKIKRLRRKKKQLENLMQQQQHH